jgi:hypothetical protein
VGRAPHTPRFNSQNIQRRKARKQLPMELDYIQLGSIKEDSGNSTAWIKGDKSRYYFCEMTWLKIENLGYVVHERLGTQAPAVGEIDSKSRMYQQKEKPDLAQVEDATLQYMMEKLGQQAEKKE